MKGMYKMSDFTPLTTNKLYIQIYEQIKDAVLRGKYKVGEKLPSEKEFCQMFNVSRVPVREALCALELNGLVESVRGAGVYKNKFSILTMDYEACGCIYIIWARIATAINCKGSGKNITEDGNRFRHFWISWMQMQIQFRLLRSGISER
ncbi:MAG: winged helix-turn-helix domain-containing protein [Blautia coccoides]